MKNKSLIILAAILIIAAPLFAGKAERAAAVAAMENVAIIGFVTPAPFTQPPAPEGLVAGAIGAIEDVSQTAARENLRTMEAEMVNEAYETIVSWFEKYFTIVNKEAVIEDAVYLTVGNEHNPTAVGGILGLNNYVPDGMRVVRESDFGVVSPLPGTKVNGSVELIESLGVDGVIFVNMEVTYPQKSGGKDVVENTIAFTIVGNDGTVLFYDSLQGYSTTKLKVAHGNLKDDLAVIEDAIRETFGPYKTFFGLIKSPGPEGNFVKDMDKFLSAAE